MTREIELLAPAGSYEGLVQAIEAGADAVYCGGKLFGARAYAENFTQEELIRAIDYVHLHGKVLYLTVNTLLKETEYKEDLYDYLLPLYEAGLDGVIVQDTGVIDLIRNVFPDMEVHTSTQLTVTSKEGVKFLSSLGATRVVLARELSLTEIEEVCRSTETEIECFIHGALCYCYSGQCLLSSMLGGRSGNRGRCAQPCRLPYKDEKGKQAYYLSLRDLCTIDHIPELVESGIRSFKIEGRMKKPEYTAGVTSIYRKYIDLYLTLKEKGQLSSYKVDDADRRILHELYSRTKSGTGYYFRRNSRKMLTLDKPSYASDQKAADTVIKANAADMRLKLNGKLILSKWETGKLVLTYKNHVITAETEEVIDEAQNQPLSKEQVTARMMKTGNTPFVFASLDVNMEPDLYCPVKVLNELRRDALLKMEESLLHAKQRIADPTLLDAYFKRLDTQNTLVHSTNRSKQDKVTAVYTALVRTKDQLDCVKKCDRIKTIYLEPVLWMHLDEKALLKLKDQLHDSGRVLAFAFPHILRKDGLTRLASLTDRIRQADGILMRNTEAVEFLNSIDYSGIRTADSSCYTYNRSAGMFWKRYADRTTVPVELNKKEILRRGLADSEMIIYGYLPLMITAQCLQQTFNGCAGKSGFRVLEDRYSKRFTALQVCDFCYNIVLNSLPLNLLDEAAYLTEAGAHSLRLHFFTESAEETKQILDNLDTPGNLKGDFTRGHYKRGVE